MAHQRIGSGLPPRGIQRWPDGRWARRCLPSVFACCVMLFAGSAPSSFAQDDGASPLTLDHYVPHTSTAPATQGQEVTLYMRERAQADVLQQDGASLAGKVVVFVQGSRFGSTSVFDAPYQDYSWMAYLAQSGFDTFGLDMTGYGFSPRPAPDGRPVQSRPQLSRRSWLRLYWGRSAHRTTRRTSPRCGPTGTTSMAR